MSETCQWLRNGRERKKSRKEKVSSLIILTISNHTSFNSNTFYEERKLCGLTLK